MIVERKSTVRSTLYRLIDIVYLPYYQRLANSKAIFMFHRIGPGPGELCTGEPIPAHPEETFEAFLVWLKERADVVSLSDLVRASEAESRSELPTLGRANLSSVETDPTVSVRLRQRHRPLVALTFDDGSIDNYSVAYPLLLRYGLTATFFVPIAMIGHRRGVSEAMLREMVANSMSVGSHTVTHPRLTVVSPEQARVELHKSRLLVADVIGRDCTDFCYPYGDFNENAKRLVREAGYERAITASPLTNPADAYELPRVKIPERVNHVLFGVALYGSESWRHRLRHQDRSR